MGRIVCLVLSILLAANALAQSSVKIIDGTEMATVRDTGTDDSLNVAIVDAAGNQITSFGSSTVTANQGTANSVANSWPIKITDGTDTALVTAAGSLQCDGSGVTQPISAASLPLPTGASTSALQTTGNTSLATIAGAVSGTEMQVDVLTMPTVTITDGAGALNVIIDSGTTAVTQSTASSLKTQIFGDDTTQAIDTDASGQLQVDVLTLPSVTVGTFPDNEPFNLAQWGGSSVSAPAALADGTANPTIPAIGSFLMGYSSSGGTTWDRAKLSTLYDLDTDGTTQLNLGVSLRTTAAAGSVEAGTASSPLQVSLANTGANATAVLVDTEASVGATPADGVTNSTTMGRLNAWQSTYNGSTWDRQRSIVNATNSTGTGIAAAGLVAQVDDTSPTAITENQFGNVRMTGAHGLHANLRDNSGTELFPAPAAEADGITNPTTSKLGTYPHTYNGSTWDRLRSIIAGLDSTGTGIAATGLVGQFDDTSPSTVTENQFGAARLSARRTLYNAADILTADLSGTSPSSNTVAAGASVTGVGQFRSFSVMATLTGATGGTLDVYIQYSPDAGTTWVDYGKFAQVAAGAAATTYFSSTMKIGSRTPIVVGTNLTPALASNILGPGDWGDRIRVVYSAGAGTSAGATQTIKVTFST